MKPLVAKISPRATAVSARTDLYVSTGGSGAAAGAGGFKWEAAIVRRPRLTIELFSQALDGKTQMGRGDLILNLNRIRQVSGVKAYFWLGAPIIIYDATNIDLGTVEFTGYVRTTSYDTDSDQLTLNFEVPATALDRPVLFNEFSGGGGINGDPQLRGTVLPAGFGAVQNVEPIWFDNTNNIGMIDGYGNCTAIASLFEGGNDFGAKVADYADYATLLARIIDHTVAPGRWATCIAQGLVGLGAPPVKPITVDATFGTNRPGAFIQRLLNVHAGVALGSIDTAAMAALDAAVNYPVHHWMSQPRSVKDLVEAIAASCNANPLVTFQGLYSVTRAFGGTIVAALNKQAPTRSSRVTKWRALDPDIPTWRMRARTGRPGVTLTLDQINYADDLIDRGVYASGTVYRIGNLVWRSDGSQYVYINATPQASAPLPVYPATSNAYWSQTRPPTTAADLSYADGTPIEYLKPAQPNADVTSANAAIGDANRVRFSKLEKELLGWARTTATPAIVATFTANHTDGDYLRADGAFTANGQSVALVNNTPANGGYIPFNIPVTPGERVFVGVQLKLDVPALGSWTYDAVFKDASNATLSTVVIASGSGDLATWTRAAGFATVPAGAVYLSIEPTIANNTGGAGAFFVQAKEWMVCNAGSSQTAFPPFSPGPSADSGADVQADLVGPAVGDIIYDNAGTTFQSADDFNFKVQTAFGTITTGVTMSYKVKSGTFNGFTSASGAHALVVTGGGAAITPTALTTANAELEVTAIYNGRTLPSFTTTVTKVLAPPVTGGTGTDVPLQSSGFAALTSPYTGFTIISTTSLTLPAGKTTLRAVITLYGKFPKSANHDGPWDLEFKIQMGGVDQDAVNIPYHSSPDASIDTDIDGFRRAQAGTMQKTLDIPGLTSGSQYTITILERVGSGTVPTNGVNLTNTGTVQLSAP